MIKAIKIGRTDNVAVALQDLAAGETVVLDDAQSVTLLSEIRRGHKFALCAIGKGTDVIKYNMPIGHATADVKAGEFIHTHNLATNLAGQLEYTYTPHIPVPEKAEKTEYFMGFRRASGDVGIRNDLWIIPTVGCVNKLAQNLANAFSRKLDGKSCVKRVLAFPHPYGCSQLGKDHENTANMLASLVRHPNAGGVLVVALGCENNTLASFKERLGSVDPARVKFIRAQDEGDEFELGLQLLQELYDTASKDQREKIPFSELKVGLKCGGSDGLSGITANPVIGRFSDMIAAQGGISCLTEVPEMFGAETLLMNRCRDKATFDKCVSMINNFKGYFQRYNQTVYENPSPGNKEGGISTLEEKSLGCTQKGGTSVVNGILEYAGKLTEPGLNLLTGPGNDLVAATVLAASGAHIVLFSTGRGTPYGGPVPTLKISTNTELAVKKPNWIDFDAGRLVSADISLDALGKELFEQVRRVASGEETKNELHGFQEIAIFKDGVTL